MGAGLISSNAQSQTNPIFVIASVILPKRKDTLKEKKRRENKKKRTETLEGEKLKRQCNTSSERLTFERKLKRKA